ncbi:MAG: hypothetical protein ACK4VN_04805 [Bacteroidales bacterium]
MKAKRKNATKRVLAGITLLLSVIIIPIFYFLCQSKGVSDEPHQRESTNRPDGSVAASKPAQQRVHPVWFTPNLQQVAYWMWDSIVQANAPLTAHHYGNHPANWMADGVFAATSQYIYGPFSEPSPNCFQKFHPVHYTRLSLETWHRQPMRNPFWDNVSWINIKDDILWLISEERIRSWCTQTGDTSTLLPNQKATQLILYKNSLFFTDNQHGIYQWNLDHQQLTLLVEDVATHIAISEGLLVYSRQSTELVVFPLHDAQPIPTGIFRRRSGPMYLHNRILVFASDSGIADEKGNHLFSCLNSAILYLENETIILKPSLLYEMPVVFQNRLLCVVPDTPMGLMGLQFSSEYSYDEYSEGSKMEIRKDEYRLRTRIYHMIHAWDQIIVHETYDRLHSGFFDAKTGVFAASENRDINSYSPAEGCSTTNLVLPDENNSLYCPVSQRRIEVLSENQLLITKNTEQQTLTLNYYISDMYLETLYGDLLIVSATYEDTMEGYPNQMVAGIDLNTGELHTAIPREGKVIEICTQGFQMEYVQHQCYAGPASFEPGFFGLKD